VQGVNAPELWQPGGVEAAQRLEGLLRSGSVTMERKAVDYYGRTVAAVYLNGQNIAVLLSGSGDRAGR
jgi:endonuclease YncB( thermonuclease family)